jgi:hypothetical protein
VKEFTRFRFPELLPDRASHTLAGTITRLDRIHAFAVVFALGLTLFLAIEPTENWILLLMTGLTAIGADNIVRSHPRGSFHRIDDTALFLFIPVLFTLSTGLFFEEVVSGHWTILAGIGSVVPYWFILRAEYESVERDHPNYHYQRFVLNVATYVIALFFFLTIYDFDLDLVTSALAAGIVSVLLGIEVLREEAMDTSRTITYALATGVLLAEAVWATHFLPLDANGAAVFLLVAFYLMTGLMHNFLASRLSGWTTVVFAGVAGAGLATALVLDSFV